MTKQQCELCPRCSAGTPTFPTRIPHSIQDGEVVYETVLLCYRCAAFLIDAVRATSDSQMRRAQCLSAHTRTVEGGKHRQRR